MSSPPLTFNAWLRYDLVREMLDGLEEVRSILEIGTGEGAMGARLARRYSYLGLELDRRAFARARARIEDTGLGRVRLGDLSALGPAEEFDLICAFEVLEHIEDEAAALAAWRGRLRRGGWLLLSVPAWQHRFGRADRKAGHWRRYDPERIRALLVSAGFAPPLVRLYGMPLGYLLEWGRNTIAALGSVGQSREQATSGSGRWLQPPEKLGAATRVITAPFRLLQRHFTDGRAGTGLVVLGRRQP